MTKNLETIPYYKNASVTYLGHSQTSPMELFWKNSYEILANNYFCKMVSSQKLGMVLNKPPWFTLAYFKIITSPNFLYQQPSAGPNVLFFFGLHDILFSTSMINIVDIYSFISKNLSRDSLKIWVNFKQVGFFLVNSYRFFPI